MPTLTVEQLKRLYVALMKKVGASEEEARVVADMFAAADLTGVELQGLRAIDRHVISKVRNGTTKLGQQIKVVKETPSMAFVDGSKELGQLACREAMQLAIKKARGTGVGVVSIRKVADTGMLSYYTMMALEHDCIALVCNNTGPWVAPWGGNEAALGLNPMSIAIPAGEQKPIVIDMAVVDWQEKWKGKATIPPLPNPLLFFNNIRAYCLGVAIDILSGALSGTPVGKRALSGQDGVFCMAVHIPHFQSIEEFKQSVDQYISDVKSSQLADGFTEILMPGEKELREQEKRLSKGIPVPEEVWADTVKLAEGLGVDWKKSLYSS